MTCTNHVGRGGAGGVDRHTRLQTSKIVSAKGLSFREMENFFPAVKFQIVVF